MKNNNPKEIAALLSKIYGNQLEPANYVRGVAISGKLRLSKRFFWLVYSISTRDIFRVFFRHFFLSFFI